MRVSFAGISIIEISRWEGLMNRIGTIGIVTFIAGLLPLAAEAGTLDPRGLALKVPHPLNLPQLRPAIGFPSLISPRVRVPIF